MAHHMYDMAMHRLTVWCCLCRVGAAMLRGKYEEAVRLIMQPHAGEKEDSAAARALYLEHGGCLVQTNTLCVTVTACIKGRSWLDAVALLLCV